MKKSKSDEYIIYILLIIIILCTVILIIKESSKPNYDEKQYARVYEEYNEILDVIKKVEENEDSNTDLVEYNELKKNELRRVACVLEIEKIDVFYPVIEETTMENLKIAPTKLYGPEANQIGNFSIVAHNYHNEAHFSRLKELENGDVVYLTGRDGKKIAYNVYEKYEIDPKNVACLNQETDGKKELTLITCTNDSKRRLVVKCVEA